MELLVHLLPLKPLPSLGSVIPQPHSRCTYTHGSSTLLSVCSFISQTTSTIHSRRKQWRQPALRRVPWGMRREGLQVMASGSIAQSSAVSEKDEAGQAGVAFGPFPPFMPPGIEDIQDPLAQAMAARIVRVPVQVPSLSPEPIMSSLVGPVAGSVAAANRSSPPIVLLHGFDGSCLEWRKALPKIEELSGGSAEVWAPCVLGWGFVGGRDAGVTSYSVEAKRAHLHALWRTHVRRPAVFVGHSLGGAVALDFALAHPEAVEKLVLIDAQAFADGVGRMSALPRPLAYAGVAVLRSFWLRKYATKLSYHYIEDTKIDDVTRTGALHCQLPGWPDAQVDFMLSGGYSLASRVSEVKQETLVIWGENDQVLDKAFGERFVAELPSAKLTIIPECGHIPHFEKAEEVAQLIHDFVSA